MAPLSGLIGINIPRNRWHTLMCLNPSVRNRCTLKNLNRDVSNSIMWGMTVPVPEYFRTRDRCRVTHQYRKASRRPLMTLPLICGYRSVSTEGNWNWRKKWRSRILWQQRPILYRYTLSLNKYLILNAISNSSTYCNLTEKDQNMVDLKDMKVTLCSHEVVYWT